ncbi:MAG: NifU family protein [Helicobacteraceae bacterium]|jgi:Fe-S cluster biogenesis protein NfuA|nr:NifU family protein [Helicobacteraceae bacterium]
MVFPFSDDELKVAVERILEQVRPTLLRDGGNVELVSVRAKEVVVRLSGACVGCSASNQTLKYLIERSIRANIHPEMSVIEESRVE